MAEGRKVIAFYSWQGDSPKKTNLQRDSRTWIANALAFCVPIVRQNPSEVRRDGRQGRTDHSER